MAKTTNTRYLYVVAMKEERHYFTSLAAIYEVFTPEQVGCSLAHLWNIKVSDGRVYVSSSGQCRIWRDKVVSKAQTKSR